MDAWQSSSAIIAHAARDASGEPRRSAACDQRLAPTKLSFNDERQIAVMQLERVSGKIASTIATHAVDGKVTKHFPGNATIGPLS